MPKKHPGDERFPTPLALKATAAKSTIIPVIMIVFMIVVFANCKRPDSVFTVGIPALGSFDMPVIKGFMQGMADAGYVEGRNIRYIFKNLQREDNKGIDTGVKELLEQNFINLIFTVESEVTLTAKERVKGTGIPIVFSADPMPVETGVVESLKHPGGNLTGIKLADTYPKAMEWLVKIMPGAKKILVPYNPDEPSSTVALSELDRSARDMGIEIIHQKIHSVEESIKSIDVLPQDISALFMLPSATLNPGSAELCQVCIKHKIPTGAALLLDESVLITFTSDFFGAGVKAARLARQIHDGITPSDIPVEISETTLIINLKTAGKIGIHIPDDVLAQAKTIIR